ncbi:protein kinase [Sulfuriferula sp. GW1]|uniref:protein kinase domain-containing protein n=1 Tax=Sulfuriferula sp. GW1 TaxID=3345111 RepID=UPI0039AEFE2B
MTSLYLNGVNAPAVIKDALHTLSKNIRFTKEDAKAANGYVFFGTNKITNKAIAVKFYYWGGKSEYHAEPNQLASIASDYVLPIHDAGLIDNIWAYFLTPACSNGDLDDVLERTNIGNLGALDFTYQILDGLSHLHAKRFLHRDLKPSNIYVTDNHHAVIGDFGAVKRIPEGCSVIPASSHSLLYRPPETISTSFYGMPGDIYQAGIVLYQLLGGYLPYDGMAWLSRKELRHLKSLGTPSDEDAYVDQCIKTRIYSGRILDLASMPPWVPENLKRVIRKACHLDDAKRFQTASSFMAKLHEVRSSVLDWKIEDGYPVLCGTPSYRIMDDGDQFRVQKRSVSTWRNDNSFSGSSVDELVREVSERA